MFASTDGKYQVLLPDTVFTKMLDTSHGCGNTETGGIIVGHYNRSHNCAMVTDITQAPEDSTSGGTWFHRGISGLQNMIGHIWSSGNRRYYLGEWHYHPGSDTLPSPTDIDTMRKIARSERYKCPEPVAVVVSGNLAVEWGVSVWVFPKNCDPAQLVLQDTF